MSSAVCTATVRSLARGGYRCESVFWISAGDLAVMKARSIWSAVNGWLLKMWGVSSLMRHVRVTPDWMICLRRAWRVPDLSRRRTRVEPKNETEEEGDYSRSHHTLPGRVPTNTSCFTQDFECVFYSGILTTKHCSEQQYTCRKNILN